MVAPPSYSLNVPPAVWLPADDGLLGASFDAAGCSGTNILTAGTIYLQRLNIRATATISSLWYNVSTVGSGASTQSFAGLYNASGTLLTGSADIGTLMTALGGAQCPLTTQQIVTAGNIYYSAILVNLASTQPTMVKGPPTAVCANAGTVAAPFRFMSGGTSATTLPGSITPTALGAATPLWVGWS